MWNPLLLPYILVRTQVLHKVGIGGPHKNFDDFLTQKLTPIKTSYPLSFPDIYDLLLHRKHPHNRINYC